MLLGPAFSDMLPTMLLANVPTTSGTNLEECNKVLFPDDVWLATVLLRPPFSSIVLRARFEYSCLQV